MKIQPRVHCISKDSPYLCFNKKRKDGKKNKTVWILTIITAILIIGGQGYWLHHQYCYSTKTFMQELHKQILQLEKEEMNNTL